jgi:hypothetical protein
MCENNVKSADVDVQVKEKYYYTEAFQNYRHFPLIFTEFSVVQEYTSYGKYNVVPN